MRKRNYCYIDKILYLVIFVVAYGELYSLHSYRYQYDKLYKYKLLIKAHKIYHSGSFSTHSHYTTRHQLQSLPVLFYSSFASQSTSDFVISALWNKLPKFLKIIQPLGKFKTELRHHLHSVE